MPDERKPCRHQRRSLSLKRKEQGFGVVETSGTAFDKGSLSCRELVDLQEENWGNVKSFENIDICTLVRVRKNIFFTVSLSATSQLSKICFDYQGIIF